MKTKEPEKLWSLKEVATLTGLHVKTLERLRNQGLIKTVQIGKSVRMPQSAVYKLTVQGAPIDW